MSWALLATSVALVVATVGYAIYTAFMAREMRTTRLQAVRPRLGLDVDMRSGVIGELVIRNLGPGNAMHIDLEIRFEPVDVVQQWRTPLLVAGDARNFWMPALTADGKWPSMEEMTEAGIVVRLRGTMRDVYDRDHSIDELLDIAEWWRTVTRIHQRLVSNPAVETAEAVEDIARKLDDIKDAAIDLVDVVATAAKVAFPDKMPDFGVSGHRGMFAQFRVAPPEAPDDPADRGADEK